MNLELTIERLILPDLPPLQRRRVVAAIEAELGQSVAGCYFIGDSLKDLQAARAMACKPVLVLTGKGQKTRDQLTARDVDLANPGDIPVYPDLAGAANAILSRTG